jgi:hypothetical protein
MEVSTEMPVFISYAHEDKEFVEKLATHLVKNNAHVWVDMWELNVGDSIVLKVQEAIQSASALLVVLSHNSVESEWCKKELSAGLIRELDEKRVVVLPVCLDDCAIPMFLRDKLYADFRTNFDVGLKAVVDSILRVTNANQGRIIEPDFHTDWAVDWGYRGGYFELHFTLVEQGVDHPFTILAQVQVICNDVATARYNQYDSASLDWLGRLFITEFLGSLTDNKDLRLILDDQFPKKSKATIGDKKTGMAVDVSVVCRRLGQDTGKDILVNVGGHLDNIRKFMKETTRKPNEEELQRLFKLLKIV